MPESTAPERLTRKTTSIAQLLATRVRETPDREAYRYPVGDQWRSMTWRQTGERVKAIAAGLVALGLHREQRVGILSNTRVEWLLCDLGILSAGGATTTVYPSSTAEECAFIIADSGSEIAIVEDASQLAKLVAQKRSEEHTSELQSRRDLVCRLLLEKKKKKKKRKYEKKKKKKKKNDTINKKT